MAGRYCSSNIKFNMDDENQRITWEFLKQSNRKRDGSFAKILSDAFVKSMEQSEDIADVEPMVLSADIARRIVDEAVKYLSEISITAKGQGNEEIELIETSDDNNISQVMPASMLDYFM